MDDVWRDVLGYEGIYQVSHLGEVRSLPRYVRTKGAGKQLRVGRVLRPQINAHSGYKMVALSRCNSIQSRSVHSVVCEAFHCPRPSPNHEINHKDGRKTNNRASNLEWVTPAENHRHAICTGLIQTVGNAPNPNYIRRQMWLRRKSWRRAFRLGLVQFPSKLIF